MAISSLRYGYAQQATCTVHQESCIHLPEFGGLRKKLATLTTRGVPLNSIIACTLFGILGFLGIGEKPLAEKVLTWTRQINFFFLWNRELIVKDIGCNVSYWYNVLGHHISGPQYHVPALL